MFLPDATYFLARLGRIQRIPKASTDPSTTAADQKRTTQLLKFKIVLLDISFQKNKLTAEKDEATDVFDKIFQHFCF